MKSRLLSVKKIIEREINEKIDTKNRRRDLTYARAVYCVIGRDMGLSLSAIGETLNRDHATVLHSIRVVWPFAKEQPKYFSMYKRLYNLVEKQDSNDKRMAESKYDIIKDLSERVELLQRENIDLSYKVQVLQTETNPFAEMLDGLNEEELAEVNERLAIMVRSIKSRVYQ